MHSMQVLCGVEGAVLKTLLRVWSNYAECGGTAW